MQSMDLRLSAVSASTERRQVGADIWADVALPPPATRLEDHLEAEFERIMHSACLRQPHTLAAEGDGDALDGIPQDLLGQLAMFDALVEVITSTDPASVPGSVAAEASLRVHRGMDRLTAQRSGWIGRVESEGHWGLETMHSYASWLAMTEGLSASLARRTVTTARALRDHLPATAAQARAGTVSDEHVAIMVRTASTDAIRTALRSPVDREVPTSGPDPAAAFAQEMSGAVVVDSQDASGPDHTPPGLCSPARSGEEVLLDLSSGRQVAEFTRLAKYFAAEIGRASCRERVF